MNNFFCKNQYAHARFQVYNFVALVFHYPFTADYIPAYHQNKQSGPGAFVLNGNIFPWSCRILYPKNVVPFFCYQ